jgi:hypothetical protein
MTARDQDKLARTYHRFAEHEVRGKSPLYETFINGIANDEAMLSRLLTLPPPKRQPNLVLAAVRHIAGVQPDWPAFRDALHARWSEIEPVMLTRATQTNEPNRCAVLLPILARLPQPLALIEVGASAGLCLLPDRYAYRYNGNVVNPRPDAPVFPCALTHAPETVPRIVWRAGLDLNPLDVNDTEQMAWLEILVWPEQTERAQRLKAAIRIAQADPPRIVQGDLRVDLRKLIAQAPKDATLVVFHTAVVAYLPNETDREAFAADTPTACDYWISNEAPRVLPSIDARVSSPVPPGRFLLSVNGKPVATTDPHGATLDWLSDDRWSMNIRHPCG